MHLVDADRRVERVGALALLRRRPPPPASVPHHAGRGRAQLALQRVGVGLLRQQRGRRRPAARTCRRCAGRDARQEDLPDAALAAQAHRVAAAVPAVEVADHADPRGVGGPHREATCRPRPRTRARSRPAPRRGAGACLRPAARCRVSPSTGGKRYGSSNSALAPPGQCRRAAGRRVARPGASGPSKKPSAWRGASSPSERAVGPRPAPPRALPPARRRAARARRRRRRAGPARRTGRRGARRG